MEKKPHSAGFSVRPLLYIMVLSLVIIYAALLSSYMRYSKTLDDYGWFNHSTQAIKEITTLKTMIYEVESAIRAFLLTDDDDFLPDMNKSRAAILKQLQNVKLFTSDNKHQQLLCDSIKTLIEDRYNEFELSIQAKNDEESLITVAAINTTKGTSNVMFRMLEQMNNHEFELSNKRLSATQSGTKMTPVFLLIASAISSIFILLAYMLLVRAYRRSLVLQTELAQNVTDLNHSNRELEQFAYIASHDLQEPLRKLRAFSDILNTKEAARLSDEGKDILRRVEVSGARMQKLIEDLLTFSRTINKPHEKVKVDLNMVLKEARTVINAKDRTKIIITADGLPVVKGYQFQLQQVFQNLLSNSVKYSFPDKNVEIKITTEVVKGTAIKNVTEIDAAKEFYKISFADNGIGFEEQYAEKIFDIFQRLHNRTEYEGTGIGLAICKRVAENHFGYINAESQPGIGTVMSIYLPKA